MNEQAYLWATIGATSSFCFASAFLGKISGDRGLAWQPEVLCGSYVER